MQRRTSGQMKIVSVFRRPRRDVSPEPADKIFLRAGVGIDGDCHANALSPRQLLIVSTGAYEDCNAPPLSLRENILVKANDLKLSSGSLLRIGREAMVRVTFECEPCGRLNRFGLGLSKRVRGKRGYLGRVVQSGFVEAGDKILVEEGVFSTFPDHWRDRLIEVADRLPRDCTLSYAQLAQLAGIPKVFCRVFPRVLRSHEDLPWQRVVASNQLNMSPYFVRKQPRLIGAIFGKETSLL